MARSTCSFLLQGQVSSVVLSQQFTPSANLAEQVLPRTSVPAALQSAPSPSQPPAIQSVVSVFPFHSPLGICALLEADPFPKDIMMYLEGKFSLLHGRKESLLSQLWRSGSNCLLEKEGVLDHSVHRPARHFDTVTPQTLSSGDGA